MRRTFSPRSWSTPSLRRAVTAGALVGCLALAGCGGSPSTPGTTGAGTTAASMPPAGSTAPTPATTGAASSSSSSSDSVGSWAVMARSPLPALWMATGTWDGTELLVVGVAPGPAGSEKAVAAAYTPSTDRWRALTAPTIPSTQGAPEAVWIGDDLFVWGGGFHYLYHPATGTWRALPSIDEGPQGGGFALVWTGHVVLAWGGGCCGGARSVGAAYDPTTNTWTPLPTAPLTGRFTTGVWTGSELLIAGGNDADGRVFDDAAAYDPATRRWRTVAPMPAARAGATLTWTGSQAVLTGGYSALPVADHLYRDGLVYSPGTDSWRTLPSAEPGRTGHAAAWTGDQLLVWGGGSPTGTGLVPAAHGLAWSPSTGAWTALPTSPLRGRLGPVAVWTGSQLLVWGGADAVDGARYTP